MAATRKCTGCGAEIPANAPFGHCPKCLVELGFGPLPEGSDASAPQTPRQALGGGRTFGDYELIEQIGRGGMGVIYKARQVRLNRLVALKMVRAGEFASPTLIQRFHLEAEAAANLHHPNIVPIYEIGEHQGEHFFSMELIDGAGLDRYINGVGFCFHDKDKTSLRARQEHTARIMAKVARAVDYAHQHGVLHRDLKPSNVILDRDGEPHLTDFGVAKVIGHVGSSLTASGAIMGTPSYMAPEQAAGQSKRVTTAADVYSLGAVLYSMLTGQPPFRADTPVETLKQVVEQEPRHPSTLKEGLDRDLATICMKCLEKEPQRRYSSAAALAEDLERWLRQEPIQAQPVGPLGRVRRWCRREPALAGLVTGIGLCLIAIATVALVAYRNAETGRRNFKQLTDHLIQDQLNALDKFWTNSNEPSVAISSERLALLTARPPQTSGTRIVFGAYTHTIPSDMFTRFAPVLSYLETNVSGMPLRIDLVIYRGYSNAVEALVTDQAGFMRPGPGAYIAARRRNSNLRVMVNQLHDGEPKIHGVIFAHADAGIRSVPAIIGKSVASADEESTFGNYMPKAFLYDQGIRLRNLKQWAYVGAHDATVKHVVERTYDVGAANSNVVAKAMHERNAPLVILHHMESISFPWVTSPNMPPKVVDSIKNRLLSLRDPSILRKIDGNLTGLEEANAADYDKFEKDVMKKADGFDREESSTNLQLKSP